jgi:hypothetical protein
LLADISKKEIGASYNKWFQDISIGFAGGVIPLYQNESISFFINSLIIKKEIERRSGEEEDDPYDPLTEPEGRFGAYNIATGVSYARQIANKLSAGVTLKGIIENIDKYYAYGIACDLGITYKGFKIKSYPLYTGLSIKNFGPGMTFRNSSYNLPFEIRTGIASRLFKDKVKWSLDLSQPLDNYLKIHWGMEYSPIDALTVRGGYIYRITGNPTGKISGIRTGLGFKIGDIEIDYAYASYSYLGNPHRISLKYRFGNPAPLKASKNIESVTLSNSEAKSKEKNKKITITKTPWSLTPDLIVWNIRAEKTGGILKSLQYITIQPNVDNVKFEVKETSNTEKYKNIDDRNNVNIINITNNLNEKLVKDIRAKVYVEYSGDMTGIKILNKKFKEIAIETIQKAENGYLIIAKLKNSGLIFVLTEK